VIAAPQSQPINQDYSFHWIRDAGLVLDVIHFHQEHNLSELFFDHRDFSHKIQNIGALTGPGEAKFNVDGTFTGAWCRPQNDDPAIRELFCMAALKLSVFFTASAFVRFFNSYLANSGSLATDVDARNGTNSVIKPDLEFVSKSAKYFDTNNCDLWEEQRGIHFFTLMVQRKALLDGANFAQSVGDTGAIAFYNQQASAIQSRINDNFFTGGTIMTTQNGRRLDSAIPLGVIAGSTNDGFYAPNDEKVLVSLYEFAKGFATGYALNSRSLLDNNNLSMPCAIGRYYGDTYKGIGNSQGNPWFLCTLSFAE
ncbi:Six-hairpin glycosidase-like protein, partial [Cladochytrium replicatum]